jgi:hypothetical protein
LVPTRVSSTSAVDEPKTDSEREIGRSVLRAIPELESVVVRCGDPLEEECANC